jgi:hypothetical protein
VVVAHEEDVLVDAVEVVSRVLVDGVDENIRW